jgi:hypothetical protein
MAIQGIFGYPGEGKTIWSTICVLQKMRRYRENPYLARLHHKFAANYPVTHDDVKFVATWEEAQGLFNCTYVLDECAQYFGRRDFSKTTEKDLQYFRQHRKDGLHLIYTAHDVLDVESKISAELTSKIWQLKRLFGPDLDGNPSKIEERLGIWSMALLYNAREYVGSQGQRMSAKPIGFRVFKLNRYFGTFDSFYVQGREGDGRQGRRWTEEQIEDLAVLDHPLLSPDVYDASRKIWTASDGWSNPGRAEVVVNLAALNAIRQEHFKRV